MTKNQYKYKIELHAHTHPASGCADFKPREVVRLYADAGVDGLTITNHLVPDLFWSKKDAVKYFLNDFYDAYYEGKRQNIRVYLGAEIRFEENYNDYLVYGIDEDYLNRVTRYLPLGIERYLHDFRSDESIIIQAHPFRAGMSRVPQTDGAEAYNMHPYHNNRNEIAFAYAKEHNHIIIAGSDFHHKGSQALGLTLSKTLPADSFELAKLLKSRDYIFLLGGEVYE